MSGRKNSLSKFQIVAAGDMSLQRPSSITNIQYMDNIGIQVNITSGSASGTFDVTISADHFAVTSITGNGTGTEIVTVPGTFITLGAPYQAVITSGSPTNIYFDLTQLSAPYIRLLWTPSSGSGTFDAFLVGKMI
jgi:hypothetical protein